MICIQLLIFPDLINYHQFFFAQTDWKVHSNLQLVQWKPTLQARLDHWSPRLKFRMAGFHKSLSVESIFSYQRSEVWRHSENDGSQYENHGVDDYGHPSSHVVYDKA